MIFMDLPTGRCHTDTFLSIPSYARPDLVVATLPTAAGQSVTFYALADHPFWDEPHVLEGIAASTYYREVFNNYPQTDAAKLIYSKYGMVPDADAPQENWDEYVKTGRFHELKNFTNIPENRRSLFIYHKALAKDIIHIGEVPEDKRDYQAWLNACSVRYSGTRSIAREVLALVPAEHKTEELVESAMRVTPLSLDTLSHMLPSHNLVRKELKINKICACYYDFYDMDEILKFCDTSECVANRPDLHADCSVGICCADKVCVICAQSKCTECTHGLKCTVCRFREWVKTVAGERAKT